MTQEIIPSNSNLPVTEDDKKISPQQRALSNQGIDDDYVAGLLKHIMENAQTANPRTGEMIEDFSTKHQAIKTYIKWTSDKPDVQIQIANVFPTGKNIL